MNDFICILAKYVHVIIFRDNKNIINLEYKITLFPTILKYFSGIRTSLFPKWKSDEKSVASVQES
jgi:hypothetical protein